MEFRILGPLEVNGEHGAVALGGIKPRAVLAVLLLHANEPVSADRLALALWGEDAPAGAVKTVQVHASRLRSWNERDRRRRHHRCPRQRRPHDLRATARPGGQQRPRTACRAIPVTRSRADA
jgi:hypothetical protein